MNRMYFFSEQIVLISRDLDFRSTTVSIQSRLPRVFTGDKKNCSSRWRAPTGKSLSPRQLALAIH